MYKNRSQGFTLIELLVVIAIIGILSAVVLASLNTARQKGNDASIQSNLSTIQTEAEIYYGSSTGGNNTYGTAATTCTTGMFAADPVIAKAIKSAQNATGSGTVTCNSIPSAYAVSVTFSSDTTRFWCVDSTGGSSLSQTPLGTGTVCPPAS